jgi:hypothetical protein
VVSSLLCEVHPGRHAHRLHGKLSYSANAASASGRAPTPAPAHLCRFDGLSIASGLALLGQLAKLGHTLLQGDRWAEQGQAALVGWEHVVRRLAVQLGGKAAGTTASDDAGSSRNPPCPRTITTSPTSITRTATKSPTHILVCQHLRVHEWHVDKLALHGLELPVCAALLQQQGGGGGGA